MPDPWETFLIAWEMRDRVMMQTAMQRMAKMARGGPDQ